MRVNWAKKNLGEICKVEKGKKPEVFDVQTKSRLPYLSAKFLRGIKEAKFAEKSDRNSVFITKEDLVIICDGSKSGDIFSGFEGILSSTMGKVVFDERQVEKRYLELFLRYNFQFFNLGKKGAAIPHLDFHAFNNLEVLLPSLVEQKKIVSRVEKLLAKTKEAKRLRTEARAATRSLLSSELHKIFDKGKKGGWMEKKIEDIANVGTGATPLKSRKDYYGGEIPWVTSRSTSLRFIDRPDGYITSLALKETNCKVYPKHSLIIAMYGEGKTRGQVSELLIEAATNQACAVVVVNVKKVTIGFVRYFLKFNYEILRLMAEGGPQLNLSLGKIKKMKINFPPIAEQKKIVARLDKLSAQLKKLEEHHKSTDLDLARLEQSILHQTFTGGL